MDKKNEFKAVRLFVDRVEPRAEFNRCCNEILSKEKKKILLSFYGYGGVGKSRFLEELASTYKDKEKIRYSVINLNTYEYNNVISILLAIRRKLNLNAPLFDYAVIHYYYKTGLPYAELKKTFTGVKSSVLDILGDVAAECADTFIPIFSQISKIAKISKKIKDAIAGYIVERKYKEIEDMSEHDLLSNLPIYLAEAINESKELEIIAFDDFESMENKLKKGSLCDSYNGWIKKLLKAIDNGLFIFASREKIDFLQNDYNLITIKEYYLEKLSLIDSKKFLMGVPIVEKNIVDAIIRASDGIPLYLDMCVDLYEEYKDNKLESFDLSRLDTNEIIERYLSHFKDEQSRVIELLSLLTSFSDNFVAYLIKNANFAIDSIERKEMLDKCIFNKLGENQYKIDSTIKNIVSNKIDDDIKFMLLKILVNYINEDDVDERLINYFESITHILSSLKNDTIIKEKSYQRIFNVINKLTDDGYWLQVENIISTCLTQDRYMSFNKYAKLVSYKREGRLTEALEIADDLMDEKEIFGIYQYSVPLLRAQIIHLLGNYKKAGCLYSDIIDDMEDEGLDKKDLRSYTLALLKNCDLDMLNGKFDDAIAKLRKINYTEMGESIEIEGKRIKGHIYKFNRMQHKAFKTYSRALSECKVLKTQGAILNNLAEITCLLEPEKSLDFANRAMKINKSLKATIEVGKTYSARSIASTRLGNYPKALYYANKAYKIQTETGYKSGVVFSLFSLSYYYHAINDSENLSKTRLEMKSILNEINVYGYLEDILDSLLGEKPNLYNYQWLEENELLGDE